MGVLSVAEAATRLGVGVARVHRRIADGSLAAERIGSQWVIDEALLPSVAECSRPGRPLSERSAWALLAVSQGGERGLARSEVARARDRLRQLMLESGSGAALTEARVQATARLLRSLLRKRADRQLYRASPQDLPDLRDDERIVLSGLSHPRSGIASGGLVEGYVVGDDLADVVSGYLLVRSSKEREASIVLHVSSTVPRKGDAMAPLLLAADLAEHRRPREEKRAAELVRDIAAQPPEAAAIGSKLAPRLGETE